MQLDTETQNRKNKLPASINRDNAKWPLTPIKAMLECFALWPETHNWITIAQHIFYLSSLTFMVYGELYFMKVNTYLAARAFAVNWIINLFESILRRALCIWQRKRLVKILHAMYFDFWPSDKMGPDLHQDILRESYYFAVGSTALVFFGAACIFCSDALSMTNKILPFITSFPWQWNPSMTYAIIYVWQAPLGMELAFNITGIDVFIVLMLFNCTVQYRLLSTFLREELKTTTNKEDVKRMLTTFFAHHYRLMSCCREIESIFSFFILINAVASIVEVCLTSFTALAIPGAMFSSSTSLVSYIFQMFLFCYAGEMLIARSLELSDAAYECGWHLAERNDDLQKPLVLIMARAQRPMQISAAGFGYLNMENFKRLLKISFSVFTFLRNMDVKLD